MPYDRRTQELKDRATALIGKVSFEETMRIQTALTTYAGIRGTELNNLVLAGKDPSDNPITNYWGPKIEEIRKKLDEVLKTMFDSVNEKSQLALNFQAQARFEDDHFFSALQQTKLNVAHDGLIEKDKFLRDYINILNTKWSTMKDQETNIEKQEEALALDLNRSVGQSIQDAAPAFDRAGRAVGTGVENIIDFYKNITKSAREMLADYLKSRSDGSAEAVANAEMTALFLTTIFDPGKWVQSVLQPKLDSNLEQFVGALAGQVKILAQMATGYFSGKISDIKNLIPAQTAILVVFSQTRKDADDFIRNHGFDTAKKQYEETDDAMERWANGLLDASYSDAKEMVNDIMKGLQDRLDKMANAFNEFVRDNDGRFFGSVGGEVQNAFINSVFWSDQERQMNSWNLPGLLSQWRDSVQTFTVNYQNAFGQLSGNLDNLPFEVQSAILKAVTDAQTKFLDQVTKAVEDAKTSYDSSKQAVTSDSAKQVFDRRPLVSAMTG